MFMRLYALLASVLMWPAILGCTANMRTLRLPTKEHPIVQCLVGTRYTLMFGGTDGAQRIVLPPADDTRAVGISPSGRLAAALTLNPSAGEGHVTFYGPSQEVIATTDISKKTGCPTDMLWVGDRGEAILVENLCSMGGPFYHPPTRGSGAFVRGLYVNTAGSVQTFWLASPVRQVLFTDEPGFAVLQWAHEGHTFGPRAWLLSRFASPSEPAWEAMIVTKGGVYFPGSVPLTMALCNEYPPSAGPAPSPRPEFDVSISLAGGYLRFRPDTTYVFEKYVPAPERFKGYKERTGAFYEAAFLVGAVDQLTRAAGLTPLESTAATAVLRDFIHDCLDATVKNGGEISAEDHQACLARVDKAMAARLSESKFPKYLEWRTFKAGSTNALGFLFRPPVVVRPEDSFWVTVITPPAK